jgi:cation diffusion facilitator CzcD-associated flavoprotein CzcO
MGSLSLAYDAIVVGGGFGGTYMLNHLRSLGFSTHMFEAGAALGGIWYWNSYPGARVDTETPVYQLTAPELFTKWTWTERYPGRDELVRYFDHIAEVWDLKKDISFNSRVVKAHWNERSLQWYLAILQGGREVFASCKSVVFCTGFASKVYAPPFQGMDKFAGTMSHTGLWDENLSLEGKRVAVIGTGASGVQVIQEVAPIVKQLTVFQRTPNFALPMGQGKIDEARNKIYRDSYADLVAKTRTTYAGFLYDFDPRKCFDVSEEERLRLYEDLYNKGGVYFWLGTFSDVLKDKKANDTAYDFWRQKTLARIQDKKMAEILAPEKPPHPYGTKRVSLEQNYYEQFNRSNVDLVDLKSDPINTFTTTGIKTKSGAEHDFDVIVLATGFDSITGGLTQIDIRGQNNISIKDKWEKGVYTHLGMTTSNFPNLFFIYGPQAPTAFATGPSCAEAQGDWIGKALCYLRENGLRCMQPRGEAEVKWKEHVNESAKEGLFSETQSWYFGDNIPGKAREVCCFLILLCLGVGDGANICGRHLTIWQACRCIGRNVQRVGTLGIRISLWYKFFNSTMPDSSDPSSYLTAQSRIDYVLKHSTLVSLYPSTNHASHHHND